MSSNPSATTFQLFVASALGLESVLAAELASLGLKARAVVGGVEARVTIAELWSVHLCSAIAESTRVRLKSFEASDFASLEASCSKLPWHAYLRTELPLRIKVVCQKSRLYHSDAVAERVRRAIAQRLRVQDLPTQEASASFGSLQQVHVRLVRDLVTVSISASGERLHKRGYRTRVEAAPLRETLASAMWSLLQQRAERTIERLWDPFCGSGVLPIEAQRQARGLLPGTQRRFAFEDWPALEPFQPGYRGFSEELAARQQQTAVERPPLQAWGSDIDSKALHSAAANAADAGLAEAVNWELGDFRNVAARIPEGTALLTNPPYGRRIGNAQQHRALYHDFETLLLQRPDMRPVMLAAGDPTFAAHARLPWQTAARTRHGGVDLRLLTL